MQYQSESVGDSDLRAMEWRGNSLRILDQRLLPSQRVWIECCEVAELAAAIRDGAVAGPSAAGIAAAYGVALAAQRIGAATDWGAALADDFVLLEAARPSSATLCWALRMMREHLKRPRSAHVDVPELLVRTAELIQVSDAEANLATGKIGMQLIRKQDRRPQELLTYGYTGALSGGGRGTALEVLRAAHSAGLVATVHTTPGKPASSGELTAWELGMAEIPVTLHADAALGHLMKTHSPSWVIVGAERIAANGDLVAQLGTYSLAVLAMHHGLRFMVVAPSTAIDLGLEHGDDLELGEVGSGCSLDMTPADLIDMIVTEKGVVLRPGPEGVAELLSQRRLH